MHEQKSYFLTKAASNLLQKSWLCFALVLLLLQIWYVLWLVTFDMSHLGSEHRQVILNSVQYMKLDNILIQNEFWQLPELQLVLEISPLIFWNEFAFFSLVLFSAGLWLLQRTLLKIHTDYLPVCFYLMGLLHFAASWFVLQKLQTLTLAGPLSSLGVIGLGYFLLTGVLIFFAQTLTRNQYFLLRTKKDAIE